ncbi:hypothetical protein D3C86_2132060 [compost metagenome]
MPASRCGVKPGTQSMALKVRVPSVISETNATSMFSFARISLSTSGTAAGSSGSEESLVAISNSEIVTSRSVGL